MGKSSVSSGRSKKPAKSKGKPKKSSKKAGKISDSEKSRTAGTRKPVDMIKIKAAVSSELTAKERQVADERNSIKSVIGKKALPKKKFDGYVDTGIPGFDDLFEKGIPKGATVLVAGGAGSGKTVLCLQVLAYHAAQGKKCLYMSFEESEKNLVKHMDGFGLDAEKLIKKRSLVIKRFNPFDITRSVDALLMKAKGELLIDIEPIMFPNNFKPDFIVVDSLSAIASAFVGREDSYRIYIEQLFRFFEKIEATTFLITETKQVPTVFSTSGVEEFLADGVVVLYNIQHGNVRERAIEVLKLRGAAHKKRIVAFEITGKGIVVYPEQEVFGKITAED